MDKTIVLKPRVSEKAYALSASQVYVFDVPADANKHVVARAVAAQFNVVVANVNIANIKGKAKRTIRKGGRVSQGRQNDIKKAYVTLQEGSSIPLFAGDEATEVKTEPGDKKGKAKKADKETK
jgi:large subunit ribosomal protein L23